MRLSELTTGQEAYIKGIIGEGSISQRIHEMGFVPGQKIKAIKSAPLKDPVEFDIMGYKLTIRQCDAERILIEPEYRKAQRTNNSALRLDIPENSTPLFIDELTPLNPKKVINVALVGNPNCGKTTIFNFSTNSREHVANYSGVTVAAKEAQLKVDGYTINVIDLPGTYSLTAYSPEELFVVDYLEKSKPDLVINVVDAGNLERNLFLTTQLIDMQVKSVIALNMFDELSARGEKLDYQQLGTLLGMPVIPTVGKKGKGLKELFQTVIDVFENRASTIRESRINYGDEIEQSIESTMSLLGQKRNSAQPASRLKVLQMLCGILSTYEEPLLKHAEIRNHCQEQRTKAEREIQSALSTHVINTRYGYIEGALAETYKRVCAPRETATQRIDHILTHRLIGIPVFFAIIWFIFFATFKLGQYPMQGIEILVGWIGNGVLALVPEGIVSSLLVDGIIGGVGGVIGFLPNIIILFFLISVLEDSGYMARTAFLMDKAMHKIGLHGKSFIPLLMGFGCNIPAIMATRTIESKRDRIVTMFITPFMSCSARLPVYVLFITAFFPKMQSLILFSIYGIGIMAAMLTAIILNKTVFKKVESPFVMELPPYRMPTLKAISKQTWFKTSHFVKKMGTVILFASVLIWALGYFPRNKEIIAHYDEKIEQLKANPGENTEAQIQQLENLKEADLLEQSFISRIGKVLEPVFRPLGFDWKMSVSVLTGIMAKEVVVSSMGILYQTGSDSDEASLALIGRLQAAKQESGKPLVAYFSFLIYVLLYFPCLGTLVAIRKETTRLKWTLFAAAYPLGFAWIVSMLIYQIGSAFV